MIARIIEWSARNVLLVLFATVFTVAAGLWSLRTLPIDAIPDLSDVQVIVLTEYPGQAPQVVEDQVTYPLTSAMLTVPRSRVVRGFSFFGISFVYIIFEDGVDPYWARSRVLEYLNVAAARLPEGVTPALGPDATGVGWVYQYALKGENLSLAELRSLQDWVMRFGISRADGVSEVASVGGFVKQYSITVDPVRMRALGITLSEIGEAVAASNMDTGGRTVELSEFEFMVRGRGYLDGIADLEMVPIRAEEGVPVLLRDVARVEIVPDERRGIAELDGEGEVASGIVLQRVGANALDVIDNAKAEIDTIAQSLPEGVEIVTVYDRSSLILSAIETLRTTLLEESIVVALVTSVFLLHVRSSLVAIIMLPVGLLMAFTAMRALGIGANIMSLGGIAIAIGAMIDAAIVMIENAHKHLERAEPGKSRVEVLIEAASEVGPALFFNLLIITVSFLPIFALEGQEGRLFGPLAATKTFAMAAAALLSVTLVPALMVIFVRGRIVPEHKNPVNRALIAIYRPVIQWVLRARVFTIGLAMVAAGRHDLARAAVGIRVHARPGRRHDDIYADHPSGSVGDQGGGTDADAGPHHPHLPRGRNGVRQGGPGADRKRPGPYRNVRDDHSAKTARRMAPRCHDGKPATGNGRGASIPRCVERLDPADPRPHRHAGHRHPHAGGGQGVRNRPYRNGGRRAAGRGGAAQCPGHHQRLCRTGNWRPLPRHRTRP